MHAEAHSHIDFMTHETSLTSVVSTRRFQHADASIGWAACGLWQAHCGGQQRKTNIGDKAASERPSSITAARHWQANVQPSTKPSKELFSRNPCSNCYRRLTACQPPYTVNHTIGDGCRS